MRHIEVKYQNNYYDIIADFMLNELISSLKINSFTVFQRNDGLP